MKKIFRDKFYYEALVKVLCGMNYCYTHRLVLGYGKDDSYVVGIGNFRYELHIVKDKIDIEGGSKTFDILSMSQYIYQCYPNAKEVIETAKRLRKASARPYMILKHGDAIKMIKSLNDSEYIRIDKYQSVGIHPHSTCREKKYTLQVMDKYSDDGHIYHHIPITEGQAIDLLYLNRDFFNLGFFKVA